MTYPVIESSRRVAFLVTGREKAAILKAIRAGGSQVPAARANPVGNPPPGSSIAPPRVRARTAAAATSQRARTR
jgi:hypothetical protein